ncbi:hypothetical protein Hdeb2414_s0017g00513191 [Helianthus debilis subsp. tardiflorus]
MVWFTSWRYRHYNIALMNQRMMRSFVSIACRWHVGSLTQQPWKKSSRTTNLLFMDPMNPQWGWSWLERYMAGQPWETEENQSSVKNGINIDGINLLVFF